MVVHSHAEQAAGLHASTMPWIKARDVAFLGSDGVSDVIPSQVEEVGLPVHLLTIVAMGVDLFDNQDLEALAETAARLNRWEFMLVTIPSWWAAAVVCRSTRWRFLASPVGHRRGPRSVHPRVSLCEEGR